jgi:hypothetical protein
LDEIHLLARAAPDEGSVLTGVRSYPNTFYQNTSLVELKNKVTGDTQLVSVQLIKESEAYNKKYRFLFIDKGGQVQQQLYVYNNSDQYLELVDSIRVSKLRSRSHDTRMDDVYFS